MPQAIPAIAGWVGWAVGAITSSGIAAYVAFSVTTYVVQAALISVAMKAFSGGSGSRSAGGGTLDNLPANVTVRDTVAFRRIVYGTRRVAGAVVFIGSSSTSGSTNNRLTYIIALAGHQVAAIRDIWIDTVRIAESDIDSSGVVIGGQYAGYVRVLKHLGEGSQAADSQLVSRFPAEWDASHRLAGCAYIGISFDKSDSVFPSGPPQNISALVDGMLVYDPRQDDTNGGTGAQRADDPSTWSFGTGDTPAGRNPALIARHWLTGGSMVNDQTTRLQAYGLCEADARIDDSYTIAAANICDESLSGANTTPGGDDIRYRCDLEASTDQTIRAVLTDILDSMAGFTVNVKGKWRIIAGAYITPTHTLDEKYCYDDIRVQDTDNHRDRYNAVSAKFVDAAQEYTEATTVLRTDSAYETQDGGERIQIAIDLRGVTNRYQADRLAEIKLRRSRMQRKVIVPGARNLLKLAVGETVTFSHTRWGWSSRVFRCIDRQFEFDREAGRVTATLQREDSGVYTDLETADYTAGTSVTDVFQQDGPATPTGFAAASQIGSIHFYWDLPSDSMDALYELYEYTASTPFGSATRVWSGYTHNVTLKRDDKITRYYWLRRRSPNGSISGTMPASTGMAARAVADWPGQNALDTKAWTVGSEGDQGNYVSTGTHYSENLIALGGVGGVPLGPFGNTELIWQCKSYEYTGSGSDGGWNNSGDLHGLDPTKTYRSIVWVRRSGPASGLFYHGASRGDGAGNYTKDLDGTNDANPYFADAVDISNFDADQWYMSVGFIHGSGYGTTAAGIGGLYDPRTGARVGGISYNEFKSSSGLTTQEHRAYLYNVADVDTRLYFARPRFEEVTGNEPSILALLGLAGTGQIPENAATEVYTSESSTRQWDLLTGVGTSTDPLDRALQTVDFITPEFDCEVSIHGQTMVGDGMTDAASLFACVIQGTTLTKGKEVTIDSTGSSTVPVSVTGRFPLTAGVTYSLGLVVERPASAADVYFYESIAAVEIIKR